MSESKITDNNPNYILRRATVFGVGAAAVVMAVLGGVHAVEHVEDTARIVGYANNPKTTPVSDRVPITVQANEHNATDVARRLTDGGAAGDVSELANQITNEDHNLKPGDQVFGYDKFVAPDKR